MSRLNSPLSLVIASTAFIVLGVLYFPTLHEIAMICWNEDDYSHGQILPLVALYLIWDRRHQANLDLTIARPFLWKSLGVCFLLAGLMAFAIGNIAGANFAQWVSFFPSLTGMLILVFRGNIPRLVIPPLLLLFLAKPIPASVIPQLFGPFQNFAAKCSAYSLEVLNVPVFLLGNIIEIPGMRLMVEEACSGMRSMMAICAVACIVLFLVEMRLWARFAFVTVAILLAIALNIVRVVVTGLLAHFVDRSLASGFFHTFSGMLVFMIALGTLYLVGKCLEQTAPETREETLE